MTEARTLACGFLLSLAVFLSWGIDVGWREMVVQSESRWMIELFNNRAYPLGTAVDSQLRCILGPAIRQVDGSMAERLVIGLRQVILRLGTLWTLSPLLVMPWIVMRYEADVYRLQRAAAFGYTSPSTYQRIRAITPWLMMLFINLLFAPIPLHPLTLPILFLVIVSCTLGRYVRYMKQI